MKYVMIRVAIAEGIYRELPVLFPNALTHSVVADAIIAYCPEAKDGKAVAAGEFSSMDLSRMSCGGHSESIGVMSRGADDAKMIYSHDYLHGLVT